MTELSDVRFIDRIRSKFLKTVNEYDLIAPSDRILVAVSGGRDSLSLLEMMAWRKTILASPQSLFAAHIKSVDIPEATDIHYLHELCETLRVPFIEKPVKTGVDPVSAKGACYTCSRKRRKELFILAEEVKCNKIALGHHRDDIIETLLMNMIHHGTISAMPVQLEMFRGKFTIIRPLASLTATELTRYASLKGFPVQAERCPYENLSQREEVRKIILEMSKLNKKVKQNLFRSINHIEAGFLP
jgi:tRNA(Ile)-lysidine synthase TilS/MesJ